MNYRVAVLVVLGFVILACNKQKKVLKLSQVDVHEYSNPILQGFYPDPSICKVDGNYYMVNSTFSYFPGIPIFKSPDLVNWEQIGNILDRTEQLDLDGLGISEGVFAPAIRYHKGLYYVTCTIVGGNGNFVVTAKNPSGPWSNPIWLPEVSGIDPSMFFDENGKAYIVYNSEAPNNKPEYDGHRTIKMYELDLETLKVTGDAHILINKGSKPEDLPIWIEGPHIYQENGYYYLMAAEGGTSDGHSEVVFRSKNIKGPYISYENNPILTQRHLDTNRENPITSVGHADIIEDENGKWWGVFLGCRPYDNDNHYNLGRETFLAPIKWENDWPIFDLGGDVVKKNYSTPNNVVKQPYSFKNSGLNKFKEDFNEDTLGFEWLFLRTPREKWYAISEGSLQIKMRPETVSKPENPSFIGYRQQHINGSVSTEMKFDAISENEKAGLVAFQNESYFYYLCKSLKNNKPVIQLLKSNEGNLEEIAIQEIDESDDLKLKIESKGKYYDFLYSENNSDWILLKENVDGRFLSTKQAGGFVGTIYGMYTTSLGESSVNKAMFNWFQIENK